MSEYKDYVANLLDDAMDTAKFKLLVHAHKGRANYTSTLELLNLLQGEVKELEDALALGKKECILSECGDIIVFAALMIEYIKSKGKVINL